MSLIALSLEQSFRVPGCCGSEHACGMGVLAFQSGMHTKKNLLNAQKEDARRAHISCCNSPQHALI